MTSPAPPPATAAPDWDQTYRASAGFKYGEQPNAFLAAQAVRLAPASRILLPGDGEGRNSVWLAEQGHAAFSIDSSAVGLARAQDLAARRGVRLHTTQADLAQWQPEPAHFDAVAAIYLHLPPPLRAAVHHKLAQALRPGGWLVLEAFHPAQLPLASGGPKNVAMLYTLDMLRADFAEHLHEVLGEETDTMLDEGPGHQGSAKVTRWVGQKPA